jgi:hypothetical protein
MSCGLRRSLQYPIRRSWDTGSSCIPRMFPIPASGHSTSVWSMKDACRRNPDQRNPDTSNYLRCSTADTDHSLFRNFQQWDVPCGASVWTGRTRLRFLLSSITVSIDHAAATRVVLATQSIGPSNLEKHNIELSCAAESPTRSEPQQRHLYESEDHLRRQLQRFVRCSLCSRRNQCLAHDVSPCHLKARLKPAASASRTVNA